MGLFSRSSRSKPQRQLSEPKYEAPKHDQHEQSRYGPHFQKGPQQEEIYDRRADGETILQGHPDLLDRAHTFHQPRQHHIYSDPYVKIPKVYPRQMVAEHNTYHVLGDDRGNTVRRGVVSAANNINVGQKAIITESQGRGISEGIETAIDIRMRANHALQARSGFALKYPQAYENIGSHEDEIKYKRKIATKYRKAEDDLREKHATWSARMIAQGQQ